MNLPSQVTSYTGAGGTQWLVARYLIVQLPSWRHKKRRPRTHANKHHNHIHVSRTHAHNATMTYSRITCRMNSHTARSHTHSHMGLMSDNPFPVTCACAEAKSRRHSNLELIPHFKTKHVLLCTLRQSTYEKVALVFLWMRIFFIAAFVLLYLWIYIYMEFVGSIHCHTISTVQILK